MTSSTGARSLSRSQMSLTSRLTSGSELPLPIDVFKQLKERDGKTTFIVPYLLFTGMLMNEIERETAKLKETNPDVVLTDYLGFSFSLAVSLSISFISIPVNSKYGTINVVFPSRSLSCLNTSR